MDNMHDGILHKMGEMQFECGHITGTSSLRHGRYHHTAYENKRQNFHAQPHGIRIEVQERCSCRLASIVFRRPLKRLECCRCTEHGFPPLITTVFERIQRLLQRQPRLSFSL